MSKVRATTDEITAHLVRLVGPDAPGIIHQSIQDLECKDPTEALAGFRHIDQRFGPYAIHDSQPRYKYPGVFRPLTYVSVYLWQPHRRDLARDIVDAACGFVETVLKRMVRTNMFDQVKEALSKRAMGEVIFQLVKEKHLQPGNANDLSWLTDKVYNFAKHEREVPPNPDGSEIEHFFALDEAMAVYLIARRLAWDLYAYSGKPQVVFAEELALTKQYEH